MAYYNRKKGNILKKSIQDYCIIYGTFLNLYLPPVMNNDVALVLTKWISMQCSPKPKFNRPEQKNLSHKRKNFDITQNYPFM